MQIEIERPSWVPEHLYPFESHFLDVDGSRVHYLDEGSGPTLLFLHGNPTWSFLYRDLVLALRDSYRCIALDYPGFGLSSAHDGYAYTGEAHADVVEQFVTELDLHDVTLMGQDWGGPIGLTVATRQPDRFGGFILGNTWAWPLNGILHFELAGRLMGGPLGRLFIRNGNAFVNIMIPLGTASSLPEEVMAAYRGPFAEVDERRPTWEFPKELLRSKPFMQTLEENLPKVAHLPTLLLWGGGDFALRKRVELPRFERLFPDHETVVLEGARHFFPEDAPEEAAAAVRGWLDRRRFD
ncbi:MAG: alpha/beta fold hydrolase [Actinomycetota bacterium]|nr:alpha/beta fold hydrolase [Actinomycetota bacterium]